MSLVSQRAIGRKNLRNSLRPPFGRSQGLGSSLYEAEGDHARPLKPQDESGLEAEDHLARYISEEADEAQVLHVSHRVVLEHNAILNLSSY